MADEKDEAAESGGKPGLLENKAILLGGIVIVQAVVAIALTQFLIVPKLGIQDAQMSQPTEEESAVEMPEMGVLVDLEEIIVTLRSETKRPRYLRTNINLEVKDQIAADIVAQRLPQLRDIVIMVISDKTPEDLSSAEGKKGIRDEIFRRIDERMPPGILMNVYFSDLVVQ